MSWVVVTGGAKGLGAAICLELARQGYSIIVHYKESEKEALEVVEKIGKGAKSLYGDFSTTEGVESFIKSLHATSKGIYGLVNNVGNYLLKSALSTTLPEWQALMQTNFFTPIALINGLSDALKKERGRIVTVGTVSSSTQRIYSKAAAYAIGKKALYQTHLAYAKEFASSGVTVNMVSPGYIESSKDLPDVSKLPMGRTATLVEVAKAVAFFLSPSASYITGQNLEIGGAFGL